MLVEQLLSRACERLAVVDAAASIRDAARMMAEPHTDLVIVCRDRAAIGVVTKTDIVLHVSRPSGAGLDSPVETVMTRDIATCRPCDPLADVWRMMKTRDLHRIPVLDDSRTPIGIVYARDALQCLLQEIETDDELLRDFISGVGYH
jgi:CBS domain-containing protein